MVRTRRSALDTAAAKPPAATMPDTTYGRPPSSGVASMIKSVPSRISPNWIRPSRWTSRADSRELSIRAPCAIQFGSVAKLLPTRFCMTSNLTSTARAGALRYSSAIKNKKKNSRPPPPARPPPPRGGGVGGGGGEQMRQARRAHHQAEHQRQKVAPRQFVVALLLRRAIGVARIGLAVRR